MGSQKHLFLSGDITNLYLKLPELVEGNLQRLSIFDVQ